MSTRSTTHYNHFSACKSAVQETFSVARHFHMTHAQLLDRLTERVYNTNDWYRLPAVWRASLSGYIDCCFDNVYNDLFWGGRFPDGRVVDMHSIEKDAQWPGWAAWTAGVQSGIYSMNHYWNGTDRPYGTVKEA